MARVAIESQAARAAQGPIETRIQELAVLLVAVCAYVAAIDPGVLLGAAGAGLWTWLARPSRTRRLIVAAAIAAPLLLLHPLVVWGWPWRGQLAQLLPGDVLPATGSAALASFFVEALAGPVWFEAVFFAMTLRGRTVHAQLLRDHRLDVRRWRAMRGDRQSMFATPDPRRRGDTDPAHPPGRIRLGQDLETGTPLDLDVPGDLAAHVFLPGASGSGKTNTLIRLADGALAAGYGTVIVDCKAGGLGNSARELAERYGVPFHIVDPDDPQSLGYDPCTGDPASVANKLIGAFAFSPAAEIYKNVGMEAVPVIVRGLQSAGRPVTLQALYDALDERGMQNLSHEITADDRTRDRLLGLAEQRDKDRTTASGMTGLQRRLGALLEGKFGELLRSDNPLRWDDALAQPSVTYIALSALASSEDVELMGRVVAQDLKQVCARRLRSMSTSNAPTPVLAIFDEFAALNEADQLVDLLLQARQALMPVVISTQYLPETVPLRKACLGAGLLIVHRVEAEDSELIAAQFGTRRATEVTHQVDYTSGFSEKGSIRRVDKYNVNPNEFRNFTTGQVAVKSVAKQLYTIVQVHLQQLDGR